MENSYLANHGIHVNRKNMKMFQKSTLFPIIAFDKSRTLSSFTFNIFPVVHLNTYQNQLQKT